MNKLYAYRKYYNILPALINNYGNEFIHYEEKIDIQGLYEHLKHRLETAKDYDEKIFFEVYFNKVEYIKNNYKNIK
jgi:hypothetical protein|nr:MAG TPA: hypothetical protein [Caudoviricetes sp.]